MSASGFFCKPCDKTFSGPEPYQQHVVSEKHKKKVATPRELSGPLSCEPCQMTFTGPAPLQQHLASAVHAKRASGAAQAAQTLASTLRSISIAPQKAAGSGTKGGCVSCGIPSFVGAKAAFDHYESHEHRQRRNLLAAGLASELCPPVRTVTAAVKQVTSQAQPASGTAEQAADDAVVLPSSVLICRAEEDFEEFCKKNKIFG